MIQFIGYVLAITLEFLFAITFTIYTIFLIYSNLKGSPYVPTRMKEIRYILDEFPMNKNTFLMELGCGDGRFLREAAKRYQVCGLGIDVNPLLLWKSRFFSRLAGLNTIEFRKEDLRNTSLGSADVLYLFLMPKLLDSLTPKFKKELKNGAIIISHGFKLTAFDPVRFKTIERRPFPTYFYRFKRS